MKTEKKQILWVLEAILVSTIFAFLFSIAGSEDWGGQKWLRRFLAPALFALWAYLRSGDWRQWIQFPLLIGALSLPYGSDTIGGKLTLRFLQGAAAGIATGTSNFFNKQFKIGIIQIGLMIFVCVTLGVFNPFDNAIAEQAAIGFLIVFLPALNLKRKE